MAPNLCLSMKRITDRLLPIKQYSTLLLSCQLSRVASCIQTYLLGVIYNSRPQIGKKGGCKLDSLLKKVL
jgi:hypothetical protein